MRNSTNYDDGLIACNDTELVIRRYYFPFGLAKRVRYDRIRSARWFKMTALTGRYRAWGSGNLTQWFNLDWRRHRKSAGLVLDLGGRMQPVITPDDVDQVLAVLAAHGVERR
ncbi:hypothetical protein ABZX92_11775 [Lentzea sp. NPDC006480]|uniref:hypothetical protein n=1 Tax=Lentzea sp. NPDC006480 TaxID=3157176 RepID=UPI0033AFD62B